MAQEKIVTLRMDGALRGKLDKLAAATRRSRSFLAAEAIREYVELNGWQIGEIQKGLEEAERGEFASEAEVARVAKKWGAVAAGGTKRSGVAVKHLETEVGVSHGKVTRFKGAVNSAGNGVSASPAKVKRAR